MSLCHFFRQKETMKTYLYHVFVDNESILSEFIADRSRHGEIVRHNTTITIPKISKVILNKGAQLPELIKELDEMDQLKYSSNPNLYQLYKGNLDESESTNKFEKVDSLGDPNILYCLIPVKPLHVHDELRADLINYVDDEELYSKLNSQLLTMAGMIYDVGQ